MRNLLLALTTGFLAAEALAAYHDYTLNNVRSREAKLDDMLDDSFPASDAPSYMPQNINAR